MVFIGSYIEFAIIITKIGIFGIVISMRLTNINHVLHEIIDTNVC